jgi:drug/metabolite transporter (DMT)-like permease
MTSENKWRGLALIFGSAVAFSGMAIVIRLAQTVNPWHLAFTRFLTGALLVLILMRAGVFQVRFNNVPWLLARGGIGVIATALYFWTIYKIGIGVSSFLQYSYPIFATIFAVFILDQRMSRFRWMALAFAVVGLGLLLQPKLAQGAGTDFGIWEAAGLLGAVAAGFAVTAIGKLHRTDNTPSIFLVFSLSGVICMFPFVIYYPISSYGMLEWGYLGAVGLLGTAGQMLMTQGYRFLNVSSASTLGLLSPVLNAFVAMFFMHEALPPVSLLGGMVILVSCALALR